MAEIPDVVKLDTPIQLDAGIPYSHVAWGIRYRFSPAGTWRVAHISFSRKGDAEEWMKERYLKYEGMDGEVVPVKETILLDENGTIKSWTEELTD